MDSLKELETEITKFVNDRDWDQFHTPANLAKSISIESAELLECFQWDNEIKDKKHVEDELADVMNYCIQLAHVLNCDVKEIIERKLKETSIKYPVEKCKGKSLKYTAYIDKTDGKK